MHKALRYFFIILMAGVAQPIAAQDSLVRCGSQQREEWKEKTNPQYLKDKEALEHALKAAQFKRKLSRSTGTQDNPELVIPIVFHVIHNTFSGAVGGPGNKNISDEQLLSQIDVLNQDFSRQNADTSQTPLLYKPIAGNANIRFCLATSDPTGNPTNGINRIYNAKSFWQDYEEVTMKALSYWPNDQYLNIWVADVRLNGSLLLGYAQFPDQSGISGLPSFDQSDETDGVVVNYTCIGTTGPNLNPDFNLGRTLTHEVGHWLGLRHTWGDGGCSEDDDMADTPNCSDEFYASQPSCNSTIQCGNRRMIENFLDYSDDYCMNLFTQDQIERMRDVMELSPERKALLSSFGCCSNQAELTPPFSESFEFENAFNQRWDVVNPDATSSFSHTWTRARPGGYDASDVGLYIDCDSVYQINDSNTFKYADFLETKLLLFPEDFGSARLRFDYAYTLKNSLSPPDSMVISYQLGCSDTWISIKTISGAELISSLSYRSDFIPQGTEWTSIDIAFTPVRATKIRFAVYSKGGGRIWLDNIQLFVPATKIDVQAYPNPVEEDQVKVVIISDTYRDFSMKIYDVSGKLVWFSNSTSSIYEEVLINTSFWARGVYIARVDDGENAKSIRILVL
jgi:hypothetical protein